MRYIIGFLVTVGLLILLIVLLVTHHGPSQTVTPLGNYATTSTVVRETIDGPVNAPQDHRQIQITVGRDNTTFDLIQGYDKTSLNTQVYPMTQAAYSAFLYSLQYAGYQKGNSDPKLKDERGYCPLGDRYVFEIIQDGQSIQRYWTTSCGGGAPSTFKGDFGMVVQLFQNQVPNYNSLTENVRL